MRAVLIQGDPDLLIRVPTPYASHKLADIFRALPKQECPMDAPAAQIIAQEEVKEPPRPLSPL